MKAYIYFDFLILRSLCASLAKKMLIYNQLKSCSSYVTVSSGDSVVNKKCNEVHMGAFIFMARQALVGLSLLIFETSRSYSDPPHSVGLLCTGPRRVAETSTDNKQQ